jgi:hypothetical protein
MRSVKVLLITLVVMLSPAWAFAQASIAGVVRDASGAVLPGVTVEAASPALIERTKSAVSDGSGQYRIVDLRPGLYTVTFTLAGFNTVIREGIELTGSFVATVNIDMRIGALEETVTVTGESPTVDVRNTQSEARIDDEVLSSIPTGRQYFSLTALVPNITTAGTDVGGSAGPAFSSFRSRGGSSDEGQFQVNGFPVGWQGFGISYYVADLGAAEEVIVGLAGAMGEARTGGPTLNVIPRSGGNLFKGTFYGNYAGGPMEGSNFNDSHREAGLRVPNQLDKVWDVNSNLGGPLKRDKVWFFVSARHQGNRKTVAGMWANLNAGNANAWTYDPDLERQATDTGTWKNAAARLTWQATARDRFSLFWDDQSICRLCMGGEGTATASPEATPTNQGFPQRHAQTTWTSPVSNRLLFDAGLSLNTVQWGGVPKEPQDTTGLIRATEQAGAIPGITYRSTNWSRPFGYTWTWRGSASYVTGSHTAKVGYEGNYYWNRVMNHTNDQLLAYTLNNGVPVQLSMTLASPLTSTATTNDYSIYAQDQWVRGRLTLQAGMRLEHIWSSFPDQQLGPTKFLAQTISFPAQDSPVNLKDIAPRFGMAYDLFGNGKTALKVTYGRYTAEPSGSNYYANSYNPITLLQTNTNRAWIDSNRNFVADCDLMNPAAQSPVTTGSIDTCGAWSNRAFGQQILNTTYDPDLLTGWNKRLQTWDLAAAVRHEILPRLGLEFEYSRRVFGNFRANDNVLVGPQDFDVFSIPVPVDPRLPNSGETLGGLLNVKPEKFGQVDNFVTFASNYGKQTRQYNGINLNLNARLTNGITAQGGFSLGRTVEDNCELVSELPEVFTPGNGVGGDGAIAGGLRSLDFCRVQTPLQPAYTGLATYTIPKIDLQVSGTFNSRLGVSPRNSNYNMVAGESLSANLVATNALVGPSLGRPLSGGAQNVQINLLRPGDLYGDRVTNVDFRLARVQRFGSRRLLVGLDIYNLANTAPTTSYNQTYGARWLTPQAILQARFAKVSAQFDF